MYGDLELPFVKQILFWFLIGHILLSKRCSFALQKMPFWSVKDALLQCKRRPFTHQKGIFYIAKGHLLACKRCPFAAWKRPFHKPTYNCLTMFKLQNKKNTIFFLCFSISCNTYIFFTLCHTLLFTSSLFLYTLLYVSILALWIGSLS